MTSSIKEETTITPHIAPSRMELGVHASADIAAEIKRRLAAQPSVRIIFAAAPSQSEMLQALILEPGIDWKRVTAFHMDEYINLAADAPQRFASFLRRAIFDILPFGAVHLIDPQADPEATAESYATLLAEAPIDIVCCGIGSNGHLAFNDPPANFEDPRDVAVVQLDQVCRQQQVDDLCFNHIEDVPSHAITLTIPRLMSAASIYCCVPGSIKREAVRRTLQEPISVHCPASILRLHPHCRLYLDSDSAALLTR